MVCGIWECVGTKDIAIVERCGKFNRPAEEGCNTVCCCIGDRVRGYLSLRIQQLDVTVETKTKDDVFLRVVSLYVAGFLRMHMYARSIQYPLQPPRTPPPPPTPNPPPPCPSQVVSIQYQVIRDEFYNGTSRVRDVCTIHPGSGKECRESSTGRLGSTFRSSFLLPFPHYDFSTPDLTLPCSLLYVVGHGRTDYRVHL